MGLTPTGGFIYPSRFIIRSYRLLRRESVLRLWRSELYRKRNHIGFGVYSLCPFTNLRRSGRHQPVLSPRNQSPNRYLYAPARYCGRYGGGGGIEAASCCVFHLDQQENLERHVRVQLTFLTWKERVLSTRRMTLKKPWQNVKYLAVSMHHRYSLAPTS